jgi:predicted metal-binding membrane protein
LSDTLLEKLLRRDRLVTLIAIIIIAVAAWGDILWLSFDMPAAHADMPNMPGMDMSGMDMAMPTAEPWDAPRLALTFLMWVAMMTAMMLPSAAPMILIYARVARSASTTQIVFAPTIVFALGYLLAWTAFSLVATAAQFALAQAALLSPMAALTTPSAGAALLFAVGLYQWTPLKDVCLQNCRAPLAFIQDHGGFRPSAGAAIRLGFIHGLYCIGCCWMLMALLFVGGVMNLLWIAALAILVLAEKVFPGGRWIARIAGVAFIAAGLALLFLR